LSELVTLVVVVAASTSTRIGLDDEAAKLADVGVNVAVREWTAASRVEVVQVASPPLEGTPLHKMVDPSVKVTVPSAVPAPDVVVEVKVSRRPKMAGSGLAASTVVVGAAVTVSACDADVNPALDGGLVSEAVMVGVPALVSP